MSSHVEHRRQTLGETEPIQLGKDAQEPDDTGASNTIPVKKETTPVNPNATPSEQGWFDHQVSQASQFSRSESAILNTDTSSTTALDDDPSSASTQCESPPGPPNTPVQEETWSNTILHDDPSPMTPNQIKGLEEFIKSRKQDPRLVHCHYYEPQNHSNDKWPDMQLDFDGEQDGPRNSVPVHGPADGKRVTFASDLPTREPKYPGAIDIPKPSKSSSSGHPWD